MKKLKSKKYIRILNQYFTLISFIGFLISSALAFLGALLIYISFFLNELIIFIAGSILVLSSILLLVTLATTEIIFKKEKYFDLTQLINKECKVLNDIKKNEKGVVYAEGEEWLALALEELKKGDKAIIVKFDKNILYIKKKN